VAIDPEGSAAAAARCSTIRLVDYDGTLDRIHTRFYVACESKASGEASLRLASSRPKRESAEKGGLHRSGMAMMQAKDQGKKRHILVDRWACCSTPSFIPADIQDRVVASCILATWFGMYPFLRSSFADRASGAGISKGAGRICAACTPLVVERTFAGSTAVEGSPKIGRTSIEKRWLSCASLPIALMLRKLGNLHDVDRLNRFTAITALFMRSPLSGHYGNIFAGPAGMVRKRQLSGTHRLIGDLDRGARH